MNIRNRLAGAGGIILLLMLRLACYGASPVCKLTIALKSTENHAKTGDAVVVGFTMQNVGRGDVYIVRTDALHDYQITVTSGDGVKIPLRDYGMNQSRSHEIRLGPNETDEEEMNLASVFRVGHSGTYYVTAGSRYYLDKIEFMRYGIEAALARSRAVDVKSNRLMVEVDSK